MERVHEWYTEKMQHFDKMDLLGKKYHTTRVSLLLRTERCVQGPRDHYYYAAWFWEHTHIEARVDRECAW